jgi:small GTP-binding protein
MIQKKICLLGTSAVGKTSLVSRFVKSIFSDRYLTNIGVKIDKKVVHVGDREVNLMVWDLAGEDEFVQIRESYLRGMSGYLLVMDGTRRNTLDKALEIQERIDNALSRIPFILVVNKSDLTDEWDIDEATANKLSSLGWHTITTSAKTGAGVEEAFVKLTQRMVEE